jgi:hypothetical protein
MELTLLLVAALALVNIVASVAVLRVPVLSPSQRVLQLALIWFIPVIGAIVCIAFVSSQATRPTSSSTVDPLYLPSDGGVPDSPSIGGCGCGGSDAGGSGSSD